MQIPILSLSDALDAASRPKFLADLRHALVNVGFFHLVDFATHGPSAQDFLDITAQAKAFFAMPLEKKLEVEMINSPHFLGFTRLANEITAKQIDWREQIDLATELPLPPDNEPLYKQIEGPNLWPDEQVVPLFRPTVESYISKMTGLAHFVRHLICESIGLPADALDGYFKENQQCKMKLVSYPDQTEIGSQPQSSGQGCGPHRDSDFLTFIYQATSHQDSLWVQDFRGEWVPVQTIPNGLVVNGGQTLEALTNGVCRASIHKVTTPKAGEGTRISIPFFLTINLDSFRASVQDFPPEVVQMQRLRDDAIDKWGKDIGFQFKPDMEKHPVGYTVLRNRIKAHQDVAKRWYPELLKEVLLEY